MRVLGVCVCSCAYYLNGFYKVPRVIKKIIQLFGSFMDGIDAFSLDNIDDILAI